MSQVSWIDIRHADNQKKETISWGQQPGQKRQWQSVLSFLETTEELQRPTLGWDGRRKKTVKDGVGDKSKG